jgi:DNA-binding TFAR19-related protein (PDSD5 family)
MKAGEKSVFIQVEGVPSRIIMDEDAELKLITQRKLAQMRRRAQAVTPQKQRKVEKTDREVVLSALIDRGDEVLETAYAAYPADTGSVVREIANLVRSGRLTEKISGGELYSLFRSLGMRFNLNTTMKVEEKGRLVDISEKLRGKKEWEQTR